MIPYQLPDEADRQLAEINMIPMIDIMLVLLIVFMITAPLLTHAVKLQLPQASSQPTPAEPAALQIAIDAQQQLFVDGQPLSREALSARLQQAAGRAQPPALHLYIDETVPYRQIADLLAEAARLDLSKVAFVHRPEATP